MSYNTKIIVALDVDNSDLHPLVAQLDPHLCRLKVGKTLFTRYGPSWIKTLQSKGFEVFLDLKFHDIPQQVYGACLEAAQLGVWMLNVHAMGGSAMLKAAKEAVDSAAFHIAKKPLLIGVTLLTSASATELTELGIDSSVEDTVMRLATLCYEAGLDGVVCSAQETTLLKKTFGRDFICVTPGIRLPKDDKQDQQRVMTPEEAISAGSDYLVIGRSITHTQSPENTLKHICERIEV